MGYLSQPTDFPPTNIDQRNNGNGEEIVEVGVLKKSGSFGVFEI